MINAEADDESFFQFNLIHLCLKICIPTLLSKAMWKIGFTLSLHSEIKDLQRIIKILKAPILDNKTSFSSMPKIN